MITKQDWQDLIDGTEVYSIWLERHLRAGDSVSMGFTAESQTPKLLSATAQRRAYEVTCPECKSHFPNWHNWYDAKREVDELKAMCEQGHVIPQRNFLIGKDITNEQFWASLNKKVSTKPLTKRR